MKLYIAFLLCLGTLFVSGQSKRNIEYSGLFDSYYYKGLITYELGVGVSLYSGDVCDELDCNKIGPSFSFGMGTKLWPHVYFGGELSYWSYGATNEDKNFDLSGTGYALSAMGRYYILDDVVRRHGDLRKKPRFFKPYVALGLGVALLSPGVKTIDTSVDVGAGNTTVFYVPLGLGAAFDISRRSSIMVEFIGNYAFSDQIDGLTKDQVPGSEKNDLMGHVNVKFAWTPGARRMKRKKIVMHPPSSSSNSSDGEAGTTDETTSTETNTETTPEAATEESTDNNDTVEEEATEEEVQTETTEDSEEEYYEEEEEEEGYYEEEEETSEEAPLDNW